MFKQVITPMLAIAATISIFAIPNAVMAAPAGPSIEVTYADLDLTTKAGQKKLERRIERAARNVCGVDDLRTGTRIASAEAGACYRQAMRDVRNSVAAAANRSSSGG